MWIDPFKAMIFWEYKTGTELITLYYGNKQLEIEYEADEDKIKMIPNGINTERFIPARRKRLTSYPPIIGMVARIDTLKDIKTFIQVVAHIKQVIPEIKAYVVGPIEEYPDYYHECLALRSLLGLDDTIIFTGPANVVEYYHKFDVFLLTSVKEAMPLAIMEAMANQMAEVGINRIEKYYTEKWSKRPIIKFIPLVWTNQKPSFEHSKGNSIDCKLVIIGLLLDERGFPKVSKYFSFKTIREDKSKGVKIEIKG